MKRLSFLIILSLFIGFWSCNKDDEVKTTDLIVSVVYPDLYAEDSAAGVSVEITSMESQKKTTLETNAEGSVTFPDLIPGTYNIVANMTLTPEQAEVLTGIAQEIVLSGNLSNVMVAGSNTLTVTIQLIGSKAGNLLLKEIYYTGSRTPSDGAYFLDQFYEIYNNSTETIYADSLVLANCMPGNANKSIPGWSDDPNHVYLGSVWRIPGTGKDHPIEPGKSIIISKNGTNHREDPNGNPNCPYPGSIADFETYIDREDTRDVDNPGVPNMEMLHHYAGYYFLSAVGGPGIVIFKVDNFENLERVTEPGSPYTFEYIKLPVEYIIDGVEAGRNEDQIPFKRFHSNVDAGMIWCSGTYVGESIRRKTVKIIDGRRILKDTNNSTQDFEVITPPTPKAFD